MDGQDLWNWLLTFYAVDSPDLQTIHLALTEITQQCKMNPDAKIQFKEAVQKLAPQTSWVCSQFEVF